MRRGFDVVLGLFGLGLVVAMVLGVLAIYQQTFVDRVDVQLKTGPVGNAMRVGSDVKVRGVPVGRVKKITSTGDGAVLTLAIEPGEADKIPDDSVARLLPKTLFGDRFVALQSPPGSTVTTPIASGDVLVEDSSAPAVEIQELFDKLLPVLQAVQPEKLNAMLSELATFLRGRGATIGDTQVIAANYLGKLNPMVPQLADDLSALGRVAQNYSDAAPDLLSALDDMSVASTTLVDDQQQLQSTLARVTDAADAGTGFVSANESNIVVLSAESRRALRAVRPYANTFPCVFASVRAFIPKMDKELGAGTTRPGLQADVTIVAARPPYKPGKDAPGLSSKGKARCPQHTPAGVAGRTTGDPVDGSAAGPQVLGLGLANSPQENRVVAELLAPGRGIDASQFPGWGSLLLGPILRGSTLELR